MQRRIGRGQAPVIVQMALGPNLSRLTLWALFWVSALLSLACLIRGFQDPRYFLGGFLGISAVWYLTAIRWMDRNHAW